MREIAILIISFFLSYNTYSQSNINQLLDSLGINPITISFHPKGDILISTDLNREDMTQYLLLISHISDTMSIDTLKCDRPNRSAFSKNGEFLIYNFNDPISDKFYTVKRKYDGPKNIGDPFYISEHLFADNMYYYFMDENEDFYYYTYVQKNRSQGGLLYSKFENGRYQKPQMIHPDRENAVAYSPVILNEETMIFAQHGIKDNTYRGVHYSIKNKNGEWSDPILLDEIPMSNVITFFDENTVAFLVAKNARVKFYDKAYLLDLIQSNIN
jgi:hypothetical protein